MYGLNLLYSFIGTVIQKTRQLFNISRTDEYRLWYFNTNKDCHCYITLSDLKETVVGTCCVMKEENVYFMWESLLNTKMV